jgi:hypothetical protein
MFGKKSQSSKLEWAINGWAQEIACLEPVIRHARMSYIASAVSATGLDNDATEAQDLFRKVYDRARELIGAEEKIGDLYPPAHIKSEAVDRRINEIFRGDFSRP